MEVYDRLYGVFHIEEPVLVELLKSPTVTRLAKIDQTGLPEEFSYRGRFSRLEHSVRVQTLLSLLDFPTEKTTIKVKFRFVDPIYEENGKIHRLSETDRIFAEEVEMARLENEKWVYPVSVNAVFYGNNTM